MDMYYCTRTNLWGMYILRAIQIQDFRDFIFVNLLLLYVVL